MDAKHFAVYLLTNRRNGTLYVGVTSNLVKRVWEHRDGVVDGFSERFATKHLVWFEMHDCAASAIAREKQLKKWNRSWKLELIESSNPYWRDLWVEIIR